MNIFFGHEQWNLVLNMMIGMRTSLNNIYGSNSLSEKDFTMTGTYNLVKVKRLNDNTSNHISIFYDYAPNVFAKIRAIFGIHHN